MLTAKMHVWPAPCAEGPPPSSTALPPCHCLRASQAPALHCTRCRPPPTVHRSPACCIVLVLALALPRRAERPSLRRRQHRSAAQRSTPHSLAIDRTARSLAAACPDPAPFPSQLCSSRAAPVGPISLRLRQGSRCRRRVPRPAASISGAPQDAGQLPSAPSVGPG